MAAVDLIMQYDPRQTSAPPKPIEPTGFFTGIQIRPIIMGAVVDMIATFALVALYYRFYVARGSGAAEGFEEEMAKYWVSGDGLVVSLLLGSLGTLFGGFYAAYKAGTLEMKHGALVGVCSIILGLLLQPGSSENQAPEWFLALSLAAAIPAGALGGFFAEMFSGVTGKKSSPTRLSPDR